MTTASAAPTGEITLPTQFTRLRTVPSGWAAVCPCTAWPVCWRLPKVLGVGHQWKELKGNNNQETHKRKAIPRVSPTQQFHMLLACGRGE